MKKKKSGLFVRAAVWVRGSSIPAHQREEGGNENMRRREKRDEPGEVAEAKECRHHPPAGEPPERERGSRVQPDAHRESATAEELLSQTEHNEPREATSLSRGPKKRRWKNCSRVRIQEDIAEMQRLCMSAAVALRRGGEYI
ncbi:hypothetical protein EYF80_027707 [Liparis tanakae]|uniref:Uncharacterized protein n=1 Tax=Liparis tanakae TaxID=230148 RepID=A0A4Z2HA22_9TELE|nr:hypothetical protein EYF80_027707 [Liparis tanakae]